MSQAQQTDPTAGVSDVKPSTRERIFGGIGGFLSGATGQDFRDSPLDEAIQKHHQARLDEARMHRKNLATYTAILLTGIDPDTNEKLTPEKRAMYENWKASAQAAYEKAAGVSKETKGALAKGKAILDHLLGRAGAQQGSGQGTGAAAAPTGMPPPPASGGAGAGAAPEQVPSARVTTGLTPPPTDDYAMAGQLEAPRLEQRMTMTQALDFEKRKQDILTRGRIAEEKAKTFAERQERPYTLETADGILQYHPEDQTWTPIKGAKPKAKVAHETEEDKYIAEYMDAHPNAGRGEAIAAYKRLGREDERDPAQLAEDDEGRTVLFHPKSGTVTPAPSGLHARGAHAKQQADYEKNIKPNEDALAYAENYLAKGMFSGPGDEALMDQFFQLAKPATGFRMTKPQQDMLQQSRDWVEAVKAKGGHIAGGVWFSDEQRQQIVRTMRELANAKLGMVEVVFPGDPTHVRIPRSALPEAKAKYGAIEAQAQ